MPYNPNIPQPNDLISQSQSDILGNFQALQTLIDVNHVDFASGDQGKHKWVSFPVQGGAPVFAAGEEGLYNLPYNNGTNTRNELFVHKQTQAATADIPFTASILSSNAASNDIAGWTYMPSGILMRWDQGNCVGNTLVTLNPPFPAFNNIFSVFLTPISATAAFQVSLVSIVSATQFRVFATGAGGQVKFLVIGR